MGKIKDLTLDSQNKLLEYHSTWTFLGNEEVTLAEIQEIDVNDDFIRNHMRRSHFAFLTSQYLHYAIYRSDEDLLRDLLQNGADQNILDKGMIKRTPLQYAAEMGRAKMTKILLDAGADPRVVDDDIGFPCPCWKPTTLLWNFIDLMKGKEVNRSETSRVIGKAYNAFASHIDDSESLHFIQRTKKLA